MLISVEIPQSQVHCSVQIDGIDEIKVSGMTISSDKATDKHDNSWYLFYFKTKACGGGWDWVRSFLFESVTGVTLPSLIADVKISVLC